MIEQSRALRKQQVRAPDDTEDSYFQIISMMLVGRTTQALTKTSIHHANDVRVPVNNVLPPPYLSIMNSRVVSVCDVGSATIRIKWHTLW